MDAGKPLMVTVLSSLERWSGISPTLSSIVSASLKPAAMVTARMLCGYAG
jgi:hypothetical protein